ncbi:MAG: tropomyosin [Alphaproteobacteria bacterium]|nr:tropomyosin [Alphaproteobacteria bacterium]
MFDFKSVILPATISVFGGLLGPILVEKWKGGEEGARKQIVIEERLKKIEEKSETSSSGLAERVASVENQLKKLELSTSHNTGILEDRFPNIPLKSVLN